MKIGHLTITQAGLVSALTFVVGQLVAFVPSLGTDKQNLISAGSAVIAAVFLVANAVHHLADSKTTVLAPGTIGYVSSWSGGGVGVPPANLPAPPAA